MLLLVSAGSALASASIRFVHAVPGAGPATLNISVDGAGVSGSPVSFGKVSEPLEVKAGAAKLTVAPTDGKAALASGSEALVDGAKYTVVALPKKEGKGADVKVFRDGKPKSGVARFRAIHAGPELGSPDVKVGSSVVAEKLAYGDATDYADVSPGTQDVSVTRAGGKGGPLATKPDVPLSTGTATTAVIVGSRGEPTRIVTISDGTAAPVGAPATGFGGMAADDGGTPSRVSVALLWALIAGLMGAACWTIAGRR
jgi:hypothetical protein